MAESLYSLWLLDTDLGTAAAELPWITGDEPENYDGSDRTRARDGHALRVLLRISQEDINTARITVNAPWFVDGVTWADDFLLRNMRDIAIRDLDMARLIAGYPWYADGSFDPWFASHALWSLIDIASRDKELAWDIARLWFADGAPTGTVGNLADLMSADIELARQLAAAPWLADGITEDEDAAVRIVNQLAASDIEFARWISEQTWFKSGRTLATYVLSSLNSFAVRHPDDLSVLRAQSWFADGLDDEEATFVITMGWVIRNSPELYADLLEAHYTQRRTVSLPMAGDVDIWIIQNTPFPQGEDLLTVIEDTVRFSEQVMQVPFPTSDIILLVVDNVGEGYGLHTARHLSSFMLAVRRPDGVRSVRHETAHYYTTPVIGLQWLTEGLAEFLAAYARDRTGVQSMADRMTEVSQEIQSRCLELNEIENIRQYTYIWGRSGHFCIYAMGENLLLNVFEQFGGDVLTSVLEELYRNGVSTGTEREMEDLVLDAFLKHVPVERHGEFVDLYRRLHGGPYEEPVEDDHGDEAVVATEILVGEAAAGLLDYQFDFDYFRFHAEKGQRYRIAVEHEKLLSSSVSLYGSDGMTYERLMDRWTDAGPASDGPQLRWIAPDSGTFFVAVHNFGGHSGKYRLEIAPVESVLDDHGDDVSTATAISIGEVTAGVIDHDFDLDFFRLQAEAGREYRVRIRADTGPLLVYLYLYSPDDTTPTQRLASDGIDVSEGGYYSTWVAPSSGEYLLIAYGRHGTAGQYRLLVADSDSPKFDFTR